MTDPELERFESELRRSKPARLPDHLVARLQTLELSNTDAAPKAVALATNSLSIPQILRWLIPATAAILVVAAIWRSERTANNHKDNANPGSQVVAAPTTAPVLTADNVQIGQELVSSFDAVATLPSGEPVRFRCQQWMDQVVLRDKSQGFLVNSRTPRFEVVSMGFESY